jgi:type I restriction enzyme R subunit
MLTTGVDVPTCKNVVLFKPIASIVDFKQIIGRGTRVREEFKKLWFTIIDYTGATSLFADKDFDGEPERPPRIETIDAQGNVIATEETEIENGTPTEEREPTATVPPQLQFDEGREQPRKYYVDDVPVVIIAEQAYELDPDGKILRTVEFTRFAREQIRRIIPNAEHLRRIWSQQQQRDEIIQGLKMRGVDFDHLAKVTNQPDADPLDLLLYVAYNAPLLSRRQRADALKSKRANFFNTFTPAARQVLDVILDKYADYGFNQLSDWDDLLKIPPLSQQGTPIEIAARFGGALEMKQAVEKMQALLYAE